MLQIFPPAGPRMWAVAGTICHCGRLMRRTGMRWDRVNRDPSTPPGTLRKAESSRDLSAADVPSTRDAAPVEALDERRLGFSTRRPGQGRKSLRVQPLSCSPETGKVLLRDALPVHQSRASTPRVTPGFVYTEPFPGLGESKSQIEILRSGLRFFETAYA